MVRCMQVTIVISRGAAESNQWEFESVLAGLCAADGLDVLLIPHLYHLGEPSGVWRRMAGIEGRLVVATWLFPRPAEGLLRRHGIGGTSALAVLDLKDFATAAEAFASIRETLQRNDPDGGPDRDAASPSHQAAAQQSGAGSPHANLEEVLEPVAERWYPVMDEGRCQNCQHCLQFCLFGVYELDGMSRVRVANPDNCKPGCPACSRICPEGAIMFPLYARDEVIAGAPGRLMAGPDAAERQMFYARTRRTCPVCGSTADAPGRGATGGVCQECGRPLENQDHITPEAAEKEAVAAFIRDDLDSLLDDLDRLSSGESS